MGELGRVPRTDQLRQRAGGGGDPRREGECRRTVAKGRHRCGAVAGRRRLSGDAGSARQESRRQRTVGGKPRGAHDRLSRLPAEVVMLTRRSFLRATAITIGAAGAAPSWLLRAAAQGRNSRKILVAIFQRGAADGLNIVVPFFEPRYYELRPGIAVPPPGRPNGGLDLDGRFALHPLMQPLRAMWDSGQLALVHAAGSPDPSRSHFDAQDYMECGTPGTKGEDGWLNRALPPVAAGVSPVRAIASGSQLPRTLQGSRGGVAVDSLSRFQVQDTQAAELLESLY